VTVVQRSTVVEVIKHWYSCNESGRAGVGFQLCFCPLFKAGFVYLAQTHSTLQPGVILRNKIA